MSASDVLGKWKPYPAYKPSGVEWLGAIPAHWEVKPLKRVVTFVGGGTPSRAELEYWKGNIPWVSPKDMKTEVIVDTEDHITEEAVASSATRLVAPGAALIVVRSGILQHSIPVATNSTPVAVNQDMKALVPLEGLNSDYLAAFIRGLQRPLLVEWRKEGATVESLEHELIANTRITVPPLPEQRAIAAFLKRETAKIGRGLNEQRVASELADIEPRMVNGLIGKITKAVDLLKEYRTAVISAAVTGKIDVRGEAA